MADQNDDADARSNSAKTDHLIATGQVRPSLLEIPLDPDLMDAFSRAWDSTTPLSKNDVLLVQAIRLLRSLQHAGNDPGAPAPIG